MFRRPSKKHLLIQRMIVSVITIVAVLVIVTGTILFILGYRLDGSQGRIEQGALVQFESVPSAAWVTIDGKLTNTRTASKQSVLAGMHSFIVSKDGYSPWAKSLDIKAGTLNWLDYIRLVPRDLKPETVASYTTVHAEKASPDLRTLIIQEKPDTPAFQLVDLRAQDIKTSTLSLPAEVYSDATTAGVQHVFMLDRWDVGGRYMLLKHTYSGKSEWIVLDTQNAAASINITRLLSIDVADLRFSGTNGKILYGLMSDGVIRKLDLSAATISRGLVTNVNKFDLFETNVITYVGLDPNNTAKQVVGVYREGDEAPHVLRTVDSLETPLAIDATRYYSDYYVAIAEGTKVTVLAGLYPTSGLIGSTTLATYAEFTTSSNVDQLSFSAKGAFLLVQSGLSFIGYEIEHKRQTLGTIETSETQAHALQWLDEAYLWATYDGHLSIREFDGTNVHVINAAEPGFDVTLSQNGRYLYSITKSESTYQLQRVKLILD